MPGAFLDAIVHRLSRTGVKANINPVTDQIDSFSIGEGTSERVVAIGGQLVSTINNPVTGRVKFSTGRMDDFTRRRGAVVVDWSAAFGSLTLPTGGTAAACALDTGALFDGKPTVKCTFSTTAADTYVGRYTLTNPVSFKNFKNIVIPIRITASDAVGTVATSANPFGVWLKTAGGKQYRLRLVCDGVGPNGWSYLSFNRTESAYLMTFSGGAVALTDLDTELITTIDLVHIAGAGIVSNAYPVWLGPILRDAVASPVVTLRFDGQYSSLYSRAFPILRKYGLVASLMLQHSNIGGAGRMTTAQIDEMYDYGCEVGLHCYDAKTSQGYASAVDWATGAAITDDITAGWAAQRANGWYRGLGTLCEGFTGAYFAGSTTLARQTLIRAALNAAGVDVMCGYHSTYRGKNQLGATVRTPFIRATETLASATVAADVVAQINQVAASGEWLIIMAHDVVADSATPTGNQIKESDFDTICAAIASAKRTAGMECLGLGEAYAQTYF